jgi:uncharacterized surface protein with fasciclin (FAS1) repeats
MGTPQAKCGVPRNGLHRQAFTSTFQVRGTCAPLSVDCEWATCVVGACSWAAGLHSVFYMSSEEAWTQCDFTGAVDAGGTRSPVFFDVSRVAAGTDRLFFASKAASDCRSGLRVVADLRGMPVPTPVPQPVASIPPRTQNVWGVIAAHPQLRTLSTAIATLPGGIAVLSDPSRPITLFAPSDTAFGTLPPGTLQQLLKVENADTLEVVLGYHLTMSELSEAALVDGMQLLMSNEYALVATVSGMFGKSRVLTSPNDATIRAQLKQSDLYATNGIVHIIDAVLVPSDPPPPVGEAFVQIVNMITGDLPFALQFEGGSVLGSPLQSKLDFGQSSGYLQFAPGQYTIRAVYADNPIARVQVVSSASAAASYRTCAVFRNGSSEIASACFADATDELDPPFGFAAVALVNLLRTAVREPVAVRMDGFWTLAGAWCRVFNLMAL